MHWGVSEHEHDSKIILRSRITDFETHLLVAVAPEEDSARDGTLSQITKSTVSINYNKPVLFILNGGARSEWWTNGIMHCPWGVSLKIHTENRNLEEYHNASGLIHRDNGPAELIHILDSREERYEEYWRNTGKLHRIDDPAITRIQRTAGFDKTWDEIVAAHCSNYIGMFSDDAQVRYSQTIDQQWYVNGDPYRPNDLPVAVSETGVAEVMQISTLLDIKRTKMCIRKEFNWRNSEGQMSRTSGPAVVKLLGTLEVTQHGRNISFNYDDMLIAWHYNGVEIPATTVIKWMRDNDIKAKEAPYIEDSFFSEEDETCFIMDVLSKLED